MPYLKFTLYNVAGGVCWATTFGTLGFLFGRNLPRLERLVGRAGAMLTLLVILALVFVLLGRRLHSHAAKMLAARGSRDGALRPARRPPS
jgi:membrane protein DedA with SNARE-associated domain